jgi:L-rhamnose mutarotase
MKRVGFVLKVRPDKIDEYRERHRAVWPEMLDALRRHGWHRYSIFMCDDGLLFGYFETPESFQAALDGMSNEEINRKWQALVAPYFEDVTVAATHRRKSRSTIGNRDGTGVAYADENMLELEEVFHLD